MPLKIIFAAFLIFLSLPAMALDQQTTVGIIQDSLTSALDLIFTDLQNWCVKLLGLFLLVQLVWTNIHHLIQGSELEKVWAKFLSSLFWGGICVYLMEHGHDFIRDVSNYLIQKASGVSNAPFDPSYPISTGISVASSMLEALDGTQSILSSLNPFPSIMMGLVSIVILATCAIIAFKVLMIFIESKIVIALSPISFALLGLNALKDQGFAPIKYLIALAYRVMIIAAILIAMGSLGKAIVASLQSLPGADDPSVWPPIWAAAIGFSLLGALALRTDSIAAMLASGSSNMSPGDAAAVAATSSLVGGAIGAAMGGMAGAMGGMAKAAQPMSDVMKALTSGGGEIKNASPTGFGGQQPIGQAPPKSPAMSTGPTNKNGMPLRPEGNQDSSSTATGTGPVEGMKAPEGMRFTDKNPDEGLTTSGQTSASSGSGSTAGIGGASGGGLEKQLGDHVNAMSQPKNPSLGDKLGALNDHVARTSQGGVNVTMNTHQND